MSISESFNNVKEYLGINFVIGIVVWLFFWVLVFGLILVFFIVVVVVIIVMYEECVFDVIVVLLENVEVAVQWSI